MTGCSRHSLYDSHYKEHQWQKISKAELSLHDSKICFKWSQAKGAHVLLVTLNYSTSVCTCKEKRSRSTHTGPETSPKGQKEGITIHFQSNMHSFWLEAPDQPSIKRVWRKTCLAQCHILFLLLWRTLTEYETILKLCIK